MNQEARVPIREVPEEHAPRICRSGRSMRARLPGHILTAWWTWKQATLPGRRPPVTQVVISTGAFAVWVFALGGPFEQVPGREVYGSLLLILYTLVVALIDPKEDERRP